MKKITLTTAQTALLMAILTLGSKCLGFVREMVMANYYGAGMITDSFVMAQTIPNYLLAALISAVATAYMPCLSTKTELEGKAAGNFFTSQVFNFQLIVCLVIIAAGEIFARPIVKLFAPGFGDEALSLTTAYMRICFFVVIFNVLVSIFGTYVQYNKGFIVYTLLGYLQSISIIAVTIISVKTSYYILALGPVLGYAARGIGYYLAAKKRGYAYAVSFEFGSMVKEVISLAIPVFIAGCASQLNIMIDKMLASGLSEGSVSALNYANLAVGVITAMTVTVYTTILYPKLAKAAAMKEYEHISFLSKQAVVLVALITIPFTLGCVSYAEPAIRLLFERGAFDAAATGLTAPAFRYYALMLFFSGAATVVTYICYSLKDTLSATLCSLISIGVNIGLNFLLVGPMGVGGLALATSLASLVQCVLLIAAIRKKHSYISIAPPAVKFVKIILISAAAVGASLVFFSFTASSAAVSPGLRLIIAAVLAIVIYLILMRFSGIEEIALCRQLIGRKNQDPE